MATCADLTISPMGGTANIEVVSTTVPPTAVINSAFGVTVDYTNSGSSAGTFVIHLTIGSNVWDSEVITVNAQTSASITHTVSAPALTGALTVCAQATAITGGTGGITNICKDMVVTGTTPVCADGDILCQIEYWVINNPGEALLIALLAAAGITTAYYTTRKKGNYPGKTPGKSQAEMSAQFAKSPKSKKPTYTKKYAPVSPVKSKPPVKPVKSTPPAKNRR